VPLWLWPRHAGHHRGVSTRTATAEQAGAGEQV
jgi:hypothetical protein